ncbi:hypothetical protein [Spirilliplanes yamanashiensis]|uniref:Capsule polysaccharide biosynthesis protein n=1 Tax=Spirilliplanes yamanashiensis TaxID=42233 RepID=A0A8J3Y552_9ACTN|nr:hypothetical protein [Spirilliplanes yamanashiensis]MDP9819191.1 hypothetical protein [Spirilliplanes yamanashiensis]GIJ01986.1 hypothetical protein Sya03_13380 [Spirilliplanes yamanashiensis]
MWLKADKSELNLFLDAAEVYWEKNLPRPADDAYVVVEAFHQDIRVTLRNLVFANALRRLRPARLVVVTGVQADWKRTLWSGFDTALMTRFCRAFGAEDVIDVYDLVARGARPVVAGRELPPGAPIDAQTLRAYADATYCRLAKVPRMPADPPGYAERAALGAGLAEVYAALLGGAVTALVTSHVDYDQWGLAVEAARRARVPVIHTQQTGCLKAYGLYPETDSGTGTFRQELTRHIGAAFEAGVWSRRDELRDAAELVAWRSKVNLGRPSWWRGGVTASVDLADPAERARLRSHTAARLGLDPAKPIVAVFNHAVSDALGTNVELFDDLADWFSRTADYAAERTDAQWLFLDHPSQALYDGTKFFASVAARHARSRHLVFRPSASLSKNALWSLADLGVTVRGSVSNELPAYGIPVIQAGWSEWSACGLSTVASDAEDYWRLLDAGIATARDGGEPVTEEQVRRARLWLWLYRSGTDVVTPLVPQWEVWPANHLLRAMRATFRHIESDADPLYAAVERMWTRREPMLTRVDLAKDLAMDPVP